MQGRGIIAIIDDEEGVRASLGSLMRSADITAEQFESAESFLAGDITRFAGVLSDIQMPGASGLDLLVAVRARCPVLPVLLMTAYPDERVRERARAEGAHAFLTKPCDPDHIIALVEQLNGRSGEPATMARL